MPGTLWSESCRLILQRLLRSFIPQVVVQLSWLYSTCVPLDSSCVPLVFWLRSGGVPIALHLHSVVCVPVLIVVFHLCSSSRRCVPLVSYTVCYWNTNCKTDCTCCLQREVHCTLGHLICQNHCQVSPLGLPSKNH